jgi:serine/threonine-protein kinase
MTQTPALPPAKSSGFMVAMVAAGVLGLVGVGGIGAAVMAKTKPHPVAAMATTTALTPVDPTTGTPPAAGASGASGAMPAERTVSLTIVPANAVVEVDGATRAVVDGIVQLKGPLGAVVSVHVTANDADTTQAIAITEGGAIPAKIIVAPPASTGAPTAVAAATPGPRQGPKPAPGPATTVPKPAPSSTPLNAQRTFE